MNPRVLGRLTWRKSSLIVAVVTGMLLVLASSAMAANLGLWSGAPRLGASNNVLVETNEHGRWADRTLEVRGTVTSGSSGAATGTKATDTSPASARPATTSPPESLGESETFGKSSGSDQTDAPLDSGIRPQPGSGDDGDDDDADDRDQHGGTGRANETTGQGDDADGRGDGQRSGSRSDGRGDDADADGRFDDD